MNLTEAIKPGMIHVEHDWWFPEREATDDLHGAFDSNCNVLFENNGPYDPGGRYRQLRRPLQDLQG